jgi:N-acetylneuraminic acid mutarotase
MSSIEQFHILHNRWSISSLSLPTPTAYFSFVQTSEQKVLIIGGHDGKKYLDNVYEIDFENTQII